MLTTEFWSGHFGDEYHKRNRVDWEARIPFWDSAIAYCTPASVLEVGCGPGWNLRAIQQVMPSIEVHGVDVHAGAVEEARQAGIEANCTDALGIRAFHEPGSIDLVFTAGMLIHVPPEQLEAVMHAIIATSGRYVIAIEYDAQKEEPVEYRGHTDKLWRRPYSNLYQQMGMKLLVEVPQPQGFNDCTAWLFEKTGQA